RDDGRAPRACQRVASTAFSMILTVARGCESITACEALTSVIRAPARLDMNRCWAGVIARSWRGIRLQDGMPRHAVAVVGAAAAAAAIGLCVAASTEAGRRGRSAAKVARKASRLM